MDNFRIIRSCDPEFRNFMQGIVKFQYNVNEEFNPHPSIIFCGEKLNATLIVDQRFLEKGYRKNLKECHECLSFLTENSIQKCALILWDGTMPDFYQSDCSIDEKTLRKSIRNKHTNTFHLASIIQGYADYIRSQPPMDHPFCIIPIHPETNIDGLYQTLRLLSSAINERYYPPMEFQLILVGWEPDDNMGNFFKAVYNGSIPTQREFVLAKVECCRSFGVLTYLLKGNLPTYRCIGADIWEDKKQKRPYTFTGYFPRIHQFVFSNDREDIRFFIKKTNENLLYILRAEDIGCNIPFIPDDRWIE